MYSGYTKFFYSPSSMDAQQFLPLQTSLHRVDLTAVQRGQLRTESSMFYRHCRRQPVHLCYIWQRSKLLDHKAKVDIPMQTKQPTSDCVFHLYDDKEFLEKYTEDWSTFAGSLKAMSNISSKKNHYLHSSVIFMENITTLSTYRNSVPNNLWKQCTLPLWDICEAF